jgi:hypothetical protein
MGLMKTRPAPAVKQIDIIVNQGWQELWNESGQ